jgi:hypothetical protein
MIQLSQILNQISTQISTSFISISQSEWSNGAAIRLEIDRLDARQIHIFGISDTPLGGKESVASGTWYCLGSPA